MSESNGTYKEIKAVIDRNGVGYWTRIGVAFPNQDGSWHLRFDYVPCRPEVKIHLFDPRPREPPVESDR